MPSIDATDRALYHAAHDGSAIVATGRTLSGETTVSGMTLYSAADESEFLALVVGKAGSYNPLPDMGEWIEASAIYGYGGGLVIVRQSHSRTLYAPEETPALFAVYRADAGAALEWVANEQVQIGTRRLYGGALYECLQAHMTQSDWTPEVTPNLWRVVTSEPATPEPWVQPTGSHDAYNTGDRVTFEGNIWESLIDANVWSPTAYPAGWQLIGPV